MIELEFVPQYDLVAIRPEVPGVSPGGIHLPEGAVDKTTARGVVVYVGPGLLKPDGSGVLPTGIEPGQTVIYSALKDHAREVTVPTAVKQDGEKLVLVRSNNIFGRVRVSARNA